MGIMAFWVATALCRSIDTYGFQGVVAGKSYHAYAWCDVDRILKVETADCKHVKEGSRRLRRRLGNKRSEFGFSQTMRGHNFNAEKKAMAKYKQRQCLKNCFADCK